MRLAKVLPLLCVLFLFSTFPKVHSAATTDYQTNLILPRKDLIFREGKDIEIQILGYNAADKKGKTEISVQLLDGRTNVVKDLDTLSWSDNKLHYYTLPPIDLENRSEGSYRLILNFKFADGGIDKESKDFLIVKPPDIYSAAWASTGEKFYFDSDKPFTITIYYNYGAGVAKNKTTYRNVSDDTEIPIKRHPNLISVSAYVEDRWGHINYYEPTLPSGEKAPIHYVFVDTERKDLIDLILLFVLIFSIIVVSLVLVNYIVRRRKS